MISLRISRSKEQAIDALAVVFLLVSAAEIYFRFHTTPSQYFWANVVTDLLLLNVTHTAFTLAMMLAVPEVRTWIKVKTDGRVMRFWWPMISMTIVLIGFFYLLYENVGGWKMFIATLFLVDLIPIHHALAQSKGLSLAKAAQLGSVPTPRDHKLHAAYWVLILSTVVMVCFLRISMRGYLPEYRSLVEWSKHGFGLIAIAAVVYIFMRAPRTFFTRLLLWPVSGYSLSAALATRAIHGIEYLSVFHDVSSASAAAGKIKRNLWIWFGGASLVIFVLAYIRLQYTIERNSTGYIPILAAISLSLSFVHYYADRQLFRMRDPLTREHIGPLLKGRAK